MNELIVYLHVYFYSTIAFCVYVVEENSFRIIVG